MTSRKPIEKKILHAGKGAVPDSYPQGTKFKFQFETRLPGGSTTANVLDDSRKWDKGSPMELITGKKFKLEVWESCLNTMVVGEVATFNVIQELVMNYPTVAKTLRDNFDPRRHHKDHKHQVGHMCSMMAMQVEGGLGYDDLNKLIKEPSELEFTLELLSVELPEEYQKESWQMGPEEKLEQIPLLKEKGNQLFKQNKIKEAEENYSRALGMLEQLMLREKPNDTEWIELRDQKIPLLLNFSQCKLSENEYYPVIEHCSEVLNWQPDNVKALFRRGKAHMGAWNPKEAKEDFTRAMQIDKTLEKICKQEIKKIEEMEKDRDKEDKEKMKKLF